MSYINSLVSLREAYNGREDNLTRVSQARELSYGTQSPAPRKGGLFGPINSVPQPQVQQFNLNTGSANEGYERVRAILDSLSPSDTGAQRRSTTTPSVGRLAEALVNLPKELGVKQKEPLEEAPETDPVERITNNARVVGFTLPAEVASDREFISEVDRVSNKLGVSRNDLLSVIDFETDGSFDPAQKNKAGSSGTGLIQFLDKTARSLGTTTEQLAQMTRVQQMQYVDMYLTQFADKINSPEDLYTAILYPAALGKPETYPLFREGDAAYEPNKGLDTDGDGVVTRKEATKRALMRRIV